MITVNNHLYQYHVIGITGIIGSGKSFFVDILKKHYDMNIIEIDNIRRYLLWESVSELAICLRKEIIIHFDIKNFDQDFFFNRSDFTAHIFSNSILLQKFNTICFPYFNSYIENCLITDQLNVIVWVNLIEDNYWKLVQHIIFIDISEKTWLFRNAEHLVNLQNRLNLQSSSQVKKNLLLNIPISYEVFINE